MQNSNTEQDRFQKILKKRMADYSMPLENDVWQRIENSLNKPSHKIRLLSLIAGTAAASALCASLLFFPINDKKAGNEETANQPPKHENFVNRPVSTASAKPERVFITRKTKGEYAEAAPYAETAVTQEAAAAEVAPPKTQHSPPATVRKINPFDEQLPAAKKSGKRMSIGLFVGAGGSLAKRTTTGSHPAFNDEAGDFPNAFYSAAPKSKTEERLLMEEFPNATHLLPLSFGLTVKTALNRTFSLETGLVYTLWNSRFENPEMRKKALLQLHYIGIPVKLQALIWDAGKTGFEMYLSAGGMVEKGVYSHYKQVDHYDNGLSRTIISNEKIDGLQHSVSFAAGIDYKISRYYSIYFEPEISYYFDNDQPIGWRNKHPVVVGVNMGVRVKS
ncbi:MAG: PorT family protein [Dysgonamonadaceae bacterium]|jgi:hypothetical protein|nr:PorT family protein [Dysgonamonadaceae bacterium]